MLHPLAAARAHFARQSGVREQSLERDRELDGISMLDQITGHAVEYHFGRATMSSADNRLAAGHGFQVHQAKTFRQTGQRENFASRVARGQLRVAKSTEEVNVRADAIVFGEFFQPIAVVTFADHGELEFRPAWE